MKTLILTRDELLTTIENTRWFAGYKVRWKQIGPDRYRVRTNYILAGGGR